MILSEKDQATFFENYMPLLFYAAVYEGLMPENSHPTDFRDAALEIKVQGRDVLFTDKNVLNYFLSDNKHILDKKGIEFIGEVSGGMLSEFIVLKQTKKFAVLMELGTNKFYEVINITQSFNEILTNLPVKIKTAIFNFNGKIICDGLIASGNIHIGRGMTSTFLEDYKATIKAGEVIKLIN
ncbi:MAG: hypothetical protein H7257_09135 [Taibaiella sp.]|nr:hypothetical protein [Taibaiella sp.]